MWRGDLDNEKNRIKNFNKDKKKILKLFKLLMKRKNINKIFVFPYTKSFLKTSCDNSIVSGSCIYRNPKEKNFDKYIKEKKQLKFIIIRPFGGKLKLIKKHSLRYLLNYSNKYKNINKIVFSCSTTKQIDDIISLKNV